MFSRPSFLLSNTESRGGYQESISDPTIGVDFATREVLLKPQSGEKVVAKAQVGCSCHSSFFEYCLPSASISSLDIV